MGIVAYTSGVYLGLNCFIKFVTYKITVGEAIVGLGSTCIMIGLVFSVAYFIRKLLGVAFKM